MEQLTPENVLEVQHREWLNHPVTRQLIDNYNQYKKSIIDNTSSTPYKMDLPDVHFRLNATRLNTIDFMLRILSDTEVFVGKSIK